MSPTITTTRPLTEYQLSLHGRLVSYSQPVVDISPAEFLRYAWGRPRCYWHDGRAAEGSGLTLVGLGIAADLMGWGAHRVQAIQRQAQELFTHACTFLSNMTHDTDQAEVGPVSLAAPRLFGGFAFGEDFVPDRTWFGFNPAHFILPHYQLVMQGDECWLTINTLLSPDEDPADNLPQLREALEHCEESLRAFQAHQQVPADADDNAPQPRRDEYKIDYPMPFAEWRAMLEHALHQFKTTALQKVVLARACEVQLPDFVDVDLMLAYLRQHYADCYSFLFEPKPHHAFIWATPELLIATEGENFRSMGLAGSLPRGVTAQEDDALANQLLNSAKDRHEHDLVVHALRQRFVPLAVELTMPDEPTILKLSNIQHLYTPVQGTLRHNNGILSLVEQLHPTPALGGTPREVALEFIHNFEPLLRGWYAAPIGWIDQQMNGTFGVAIRSAVVQNRRVWMYAGAGIVADSDPQKEWDETGWKFRPIQGALGINW